MSTLDFYFDFSSAYAYIAHAGIDRLAADVGWQVHWRPIALGAIFKQLGHSPPLKGGLKQRYVWHDVERSASFAGLDYRWPEPFPFNSIPLARAYLWVAANAASLARPFAGEVFRQLYGNGGNGTDPALLIAAAEAVGLDVAAVSAGSSEASIKQTLTQQTEEAQGRGVFGTPSFVVGDELFWGADRMDQLAHHLRAASD